MRPDAVLSRLNLKDALVLAPMEGVADFAMREVLTCVGGYDFAVSEFVRIVDNLLPKRSYTRVCPEMLSENRTAAGTPVVVQLMGSDPTWMADNAARLAKYAVCGIDLNFGCPARCVNRRGAGAALLDDPEKLFHIASAVRRAVPKRIPVSAKMRLGMSDTGLTLDCARALAEARLDFITVHARTREQGYRPPAHWKWIAHIAENVKLPVIANGEIWTSRDWQRCREISGVNAAMLGRGAVSDPFLVRRIRGEAAEEPDSGEWRALRPEIVRYWQRIQTRTTARYAPGRLKMWLAMLWRTWPEEAGALHEQIRTLTSPAAVTALLERSS